MMTQIDGHGRPLPPREKLKIDQWKDWLTDLRLSRWNHLRDRAGLEPLTNEAGARVLLELSRHKNYQETLDDIKARIAE